jgi:molybdate transport system substrate-binding protein
VKTAARAAATALAASLCLVQSAWGGPSLARPLEVFAGSASKPAAIEVVKLFEARTGATVDLHFGGSGAVLSQMELARRGDVYFPGSADFMEIARRKGLVRPGIEVRVAYLLPAINVVRGNPKGIRSLVDLARSGVRVGIARPDTVCVGLYGVEVLERSELTEKVRPNVVSYAESCEKTAQLVALGLVDAVLGWDVFEAWNPKRIETIPLPPDQVPRIGYIPAAVSVFSKAPGAAHEFLKFLVSTEARELFRRHRYRTTLEEARHSARPGTPVGGEYPLPERWR